MFDDNVAHKILLIGIGASLSFTIFVSSIVFTQIESLADNVNSLVADVGYIKGVISNWSTYPPT